MKRYFAIVLLLISANCFADESKYERPCREKVFAYGASSSVFSELVRRCVSINEYEEKQQKKRADEADFRESNAKTELVLKIMDIEGAMRKGGASGEQVQNLENICSGGLEDPSSRELEMALACMKSMQK